MICLNRKPTGRNADMRCETARMILELDLARMGEADWRDLDAVEAHLGACPECETWRRRRFIEENHLARQMRSVPSPSTPPKIPSPKASIFAWKPGLAKTACLTLAVLLAATSPILLRTQHKSLDVESAAWLMREGFEPDIDGPTADAKRIDLERRFGLLGIKTHLPEGMDYGQLLFSGLVELQGKAVPQLVFTAGSGDTLTQVLVFDSRQFDLSTLPETIPTGASSATPTLVATDPHGRFMALVVEGFRRKTPSLQPAW